MRTQTIIKDYSRLSDSDLDTKAQSIVQSLTGNIYFPETSPTLAEFTETKQAYSTSMNNAVGGTRLQIALKKEARAVLLDAIKNLGFNVESLAKGNRVKLVSTGYELASDGENTATIHPPTNFMMEDGMNIGQVKFSVKAVRNAVAYVHEYTPAPLTVNSNWITQSTTLREHTFVIPSGTRIFGRVAAIGRRGQQAYSDILSRLVQ